jgi:hypothetical protein
MSLSPCFLLNKKPGLDRLAIFQPWSGRDDLDLTSPTIAPKDDPRSPNLSTLDRVFLALTRPLFTTNANVVTVFAINVVQLRHQLSSLDFVEDVYVH